MIRAKGFTLIELLVVMAIIAMLVGGLCRGSRGDGSRFLSDAHIRECLSDHFDGGLRALELGAQRTGGADFGGGVWDLLASGPRASDQRRVIARVLSAATDHPDVEELYRRAHEVDPHISIATVYRTVRLFEEAGIIERHDFRDGRSRYDALQLSLDRPLMRHVAFSSSYTLSSSKDDTSAFLGTPTDKNFPQNSRRPDLEWAASSYDTRHRLTMSYIVELPEGNAVTRHMQVEGITMVRSGQPFTPLLRFDNSNTGNTGGATAGSDRPNVSGDGALDNPTADRWFNTSAFSVPAPFTFGNAGRNSVRGPGFATFDVALSKSVSTPRGSVTIAMQVFNVFNRNNYTIGTVESVASQYLKPVAGQFRTAQIGFRLTF